VARLEPGSAGVDGSRHRLAELYRLEDACGTAERAPALAYLTERVLASRRALWSFDFPFGFPVEVIGEGCGWADQFAFLSEWAEDGYGAGLECLRRARALGGPGHIRRLTDRECQAPFDPYHYRIIYQTYHGMRDVLGPLRRAAGTAILPFQYRRLAGASRVLVEACPASTLRRLGLPHQLYKQPEGGSLSSERLRTRRTLLAGLARRVAFTLTQYRVMLQDPGGDALDAVVAAVGAARAWDAADHRVIARHPRYRREGRLFI
jgi:hypothetical protein